MTQDKTRALSRVHTSTGILSILLTEECDDTDKRRRFNRVHTLAFCLLFLVMIQMKQKHSIEYKPLPCQHALFCLLYMLF